MQNYGQRVLAVAGFALNSGDNVPVLEPVTMMAVFSDTLDTLNLSSPRQRLMEELRS